MNPDTRALMEHLDVCFAIKRGDITHDDLVERPPYPTKENPAFNPAAAWPFPTGARGEKVKRK